MLLRTAGSLSSMKAARASCKGRQAFVPCVTPNNTRVACLCSSSDTRASEPVTRPCLILAAILVLVVTAVCAEVGVPPQDRVLSSF